MKFLRNMMLSVVALGAVLLLSGVSFADEGMKMSPEHHAAKIKLLQDSAAALMATNPALSKELTDYAAMESKETKEGMKEAEGAAEKKMEGDHQAHIKLLKDAAAALQATHPELAADLTKMAEKHEKKMMAEEKKDVKEAGDKK